jgi:hypothetical protein
MQRCSATILVLFYSLCCYGQGNHVFCGTEIVNFGTLSLSTPGGQTWSTDRTATPGYLSAANSAIFTNASDVAFGNNALRFYNTGYSNTAIGASALDSKTT